MGIKNLLKFLADYPDVFEPIHISEYAFKKIAIDTSYYICNYKALFPEDPARPHTKYAWLANFINLVSVLRENEVHCFFVYDSGYPQEKIQERKNRMEAKSKTEERVCRLEEAIEKYHCTNEVDPILIEFQNKRKIGLPSLLKTSNTINIKSIEFLVDKMRKQMFSICAEDFLLTKQLFDILQIPYCNAPTEAETLCSDLCIQGKVDAVLTADSDVLAYGVPVFLTKFITRDGTCFRVRHDTVLEKLGLSAESFLDFCISCGTDYNQNIFRIGPNKAYKLLQEHKNIEGMEKAGLDVSILNHKRVRELFKEYPRSEVKVPYCGTPDFSALEQFAFKKNIKIDIASLKKPFLQNVIVFEGELETPDDTGL